MSRRLGLLVLLWTCSPLTPGALAGDGDLVWRTVDTPHFQVHYPAGLEPVAFRTARYCEEAHRLLVPILDHRPSTRVQVVVTDFGDSANGSATALPYPVIRVFAAPPDMDGNLNDYDDWLRLLVFHEYVHILQLDNVSGIPALLNAIFGRTFAPNQNLPSFVLEGEAVWLESATSDRGRIRSAVFRGILRAQALAGRLHGIDAVVHAPQDFPGANVWYMYGGHFMDWLARTRGEDVAAKVHAATSDELIPYALNRAAREATGQPYTELFRAWQAELTADAFALQTARARAGLTEYVRMTTTGRTHTSPRFRLDGKLLALAASGRKVGGVYARDLDDPPDHFDDFVFETNGTDAFDLCRNDEVFVYDEANRYRGAYSFHDVFLYDFALRQRRRLTVGARAREPTCAPDGRWLAATQIVRGRTRLVRVDAGTGALRPLLDPGDLNQVAFPTISLDGRHVVVSRVSQREGRDLVAVEVATGVVTRLTNDEALELHPRFSRDGRWLLWASDRAGVFDIYAKRWPDGLNRRVTRVVTGALTPTLSPDGQTLVFTVITADGFDLARTRFDPDALMPVPPMVGRAPIRPVASDRPLPSRPYAPSETLWPVAWTPTFSFSNVEETATNLGIDLEAADAVGHHVFLGSFAGVPEEDAVSLSGVYSYRRLLPAFNLGVNHTTRTRDEGAFFGSAPQPLRERLTSFNASVGLPFSRNGVGASFSARYGLSLREPAENPDPTFDPLDRVPSENESLRSGSLALSVAFADTETFSEAISTEDGRIVSLTSRVRHPGLGGEIETAEIFVDYREYIPLWMRQVLALRATGAYGRGEVGRRVLFALSAPQERNLLLDALDNVFFGNTLLRGYPSGTERGDRYLLLSAEYRLPILDVFGGPSAVPLFLRRLRAAVFTDWGQAREGRSLSPKPDAFRRSLGGELVIDSTLGWRLPVSARIGMAQGFDDDGDLQLYFFLGQWF